MVATSSDGTGWAGVCHTGSLADDSVAIVIGGQIEQISLISWQERVIVNVLTSHNVNAGCPEALAAGNGEVLMLQNDGITQTLTFFGQDADGDDYGLATDDFPDDANQWSDNDGDGFGDNLGFFNSDDCPYAAGNSTIGRKGCADSDGDGRSDFTGVFPQDNTQWNDEDGDGYGDNQTRNSADDCPTTPEPPIVTGVVAPTPMATVRPRKRPVSGRRRSGRTPTKMATATTRWAWAGTAAR